MPALDLPEPLLRAARKGRLVLFVAGGAPSGLNERLRSLPSSIRFAEQCGATDSALWTAQQIEQGIVVQVPPGATVLVETPDALGTPRRPTRLRAWIADILRHRTALLIGDGPVHAAFREILGPDLGHRHFAPTAEQADVWLDRLVEQAGTAAPAPTLPAVASRWGLAGLTVAAAVSVFSWLLLYVHYGGAQNWRWLQLVPGGVVIAAVIVALLPLAANAARGRELAACECYARSLARWSRPPREPLAVALLLLSAVLAWWLGARFVAATFLVIYESAGVTADGQPVGACKGEDPCTLVLPRNAHLHFDGAQGACATDLSSDGGLIVIDLQDESCEPEAPEGTEGEPAPIPRGG